METSIFKIISEAVKNFMEEGYDDVSMEYIKGLKRSSEHEDFEDKITIGDITYLNFNLREKGYLVFGKILAFDNKDGTEVGSCLYGKESDDARMVATIDVRKDKRRQGIASNIYSWIEELTGYKLSPDTPHSKSAAAFWANPNRKFGN